MLKSLLLGIISLRIDRSIQFRSGIPYHVHCCICTILLNTLGQIFIENALLTKKPIPSPLILTKLLKAIGGSR